MPCRVCGAAAVRDIGQVEYYSGFAWKVFDCSECGSRFTRHDRSTYQWLHSQPSSVYGIYRDWAVKAKELFLRRDSHAFRELLCSSRKYKFIIQSIEQRPATGKVLEVGCSRGHLTAYFILNGYKIIGSDVSEESLDGARRSFGNHFHLADSRVIREQAPYDIIYHVGTIGCVEDPMGLTRDLLSMLKPGGQLLFNAPNANSCYLKGQLWIDAAPPPDVVTLFRPGLWTRFWSDAADSSEEEELCPADEAFVIGLRQVFGRGWQSPRPLPLDASIDAYQSGRTQKAGTWDWRRVERGVAKAARLTRLSGLATRRPAPFGLFVTMTKKQPKVANEVGH
jgi:SAM-dependent methyltransferase